VGRPRPRSPRSFDQPGLHPTGFPGNPGPGGGGGGSGSSQPWFGEYEKCIAACLADVGISSGLEINFPVVSATGTEVHFLQNYAAMDRRRGVVPRWTAERGQA
jgi:hypothetical protein